jgi:hypothetical protein
MPPTFANGKICYVEIPATDIASSAEVQWHRLQPVRFLIRWVLRKAHRLKSVLLEAPPRCLSILRRELPFQSQLPGVSVRNEG